MPNLVGIWSPGLTQESVERALDAQLQRVRVPGTAYSDYVAASQGFGMALQDHGLLENGAQPAYGDDRAVALLLDGEVSNASELRQKFSADLPERPLSPPELCLHLILRRGAEVAAFFSGFFCIAVYDRRANRLSLISDRYGARPLYYVRRPGAMLFGSELKALARIDPSPRRIDEVGLAELFCYGTHFMDRTWMEGYLRLPPASILSVAAHGFEMRRYWSYRYDESAAALDQATYATVFAVLLDRAVERCMRGSKRIGVFLSGGYDSRSVVAALRSHRIPIPAFTFGLPESRDVRFAAMLAERIGLPHRVLNQTGKYLAHNCPAIVWRTEGMMTFANATSIQWHATLKKQIDIILTGFLGEFSGSHTWPQLLAARSRRAAIGAIFRRFLQPRKAVAQMMFQPTFVGRVFAAVTDNFQRSFESVEVEHPLNVADCWNFLHLQPRGTFHAPAVDRHRFEMRAPHTDNDLVDFLLTIPPYARLEQRVYKKMIASSFPQIRDVPCTNSGRPVDPHFLREYAAMVGAYVAQKSAVALSASFRRRRSLGREFRDLGEDFRAEPELVEQLRSLMDSEILPNTVFRREGIEQIIKEHYENARSHEHTIGLLISVGLAMKFFLHDDLSGVPDEMYAV